MPENTAYKLASGHNLIYILKPGVSALLQRDIVKEVRDAGVRVLKTDVAWVGDGYSFGLHGVADVGTYCTLLW